MLRRTALRVLVIGGGGRKHLLRILVLFGFHFVSLSEQCSPDKCYKRVGTRGIPEFQPTVQQRSPQSKSFVRSCFAAAVVLPSLLNAFVCFILFHALCAVAVGHKVKTSSSSTSTAEWTA